jgi:hypothetical protein
MVHLVSFCAVSDVPSAYPATPATVSDANMNLSNAAKELLRWHQRLGHVSFARVQHLLRSGVSLPSLNLLVACIVLLHPSQFPNAQRVSLLNSAVDLLMVLPLLLFRIESVLFGRTI